MRIPHFYTRSRLQYATGFSSRDGHRRTRDVAGAPLSGGGGYIKFRTRDEASTPSTR